MKKFSIDYREISLLLYKMNSHKEKNIYMRQAYVTKHISLTHRKFCNKTYIVIK